MNLSPVPIQKFFDNNGAPLVSGLLFTYAAGTSIKIATYTDSTGNTPNTNPIVLNFRGECALWLDPTLSYKLVIAPSTDTDPPSNPILTADNIRAGIDYSTLTQQFIGQIFYPRSQQEITAGITPVNYYQYYANVYRYATNTTPGSTDMSAALVSANTVALASSLPVTIPGILNVASSTTITAPIADSMAQLFSTTSAITISNNLPVRPEWWGSGQNTLKYAINSLPSTGGVIQLEDKTYQTSNYAYGFAGAANCPQKDGLVIRGRKMPFFSSDCKQLQGGSIIQGMFNPWCNNLEISNVGFDNGFTISQTLYGGAASAGQCDALVLSYPTDAIKTANGLKVGAKLHNVIGLCYGPAALGHALIIAEGYKDVTCTGEVVGMYGVHGCAIKAAGVRVDKITTYCNNTDGVIIKSDTATTSIATDIQIGQIYANAAGPLGYSPYAVASTGTGFLFEASQNNIGRVQVGSVESFGYPTGHGIIYGGNFTIDNVEIAQICVDQSGVGSPVAGLNLTASTNQNVARYHIGSATLRNVGIGANFNFTQTAGNPNHVCIGQLEVVNCTDVAAQVAGSSWVDLGSVIAANCTIAPYRILGTPRLQVGMLTQCGTTPATTYTNSSSGLQPSLANSWAQVAANDPFMVDLTGGRINLRGLVVPGVSNVISILPAFLRPASNKRFMVQGYNGATVASVPLVVDTSGNVKVNEIAGGTANCSTWLSLSGVTYDQQA